METVDRAARGSVEMEREHVAGGKGEIRVRFGRGEIGDGLWLSRVPCGDKG